MNIKTPKVVLYGGNGFVGTHCAEQLNLAGADVVCVSRTGHKPVHLNNQRWSKTVRWCKGDAANADTTLLSNCDVMICAVGSPPIPTLSQQAYKQQLFMNGTTCVNAIKSAEESGVTRVVLLGAAIPCLLRFDRFAYYLGKQQALNAAHSFTRSSNHHQAVVLQPGMITGKRTLKNGTNLRLDWLTAPLSFIMPWQFVSINRIASCVTAAALNNHAHPEQFTVIKNSYIH